MRAAVACRRVTGRVWRGLAGFFAFQITIRFNNGILKEKPAMTYRYPANRETPDYGADACTENAWRHMHAVAILMIEALQDYPLGTVAILDQEELVCFVIQAADAEHLVFAHVFDGQILLEQAVPLQFSQGLSIEELDHQRDLMIGWLQIEGRRDGFWLKYRYSSLPHCEQFFLSAS